MIQKNNEIKKIFSKFEQVKNLDGDYKPLKVNKLNSISLNPNQASPLYPVKQKPALKSPNQPNKQPQHHQKQQIIYTQSEISKQVAKLKPYLAIKDNIKTSLQLQEMRNKQISQQNYKMMSQLAILQNRRLCEIVGEYSGVEGDKVEERKEMEKQGWIFQLFHRSVHNPKDDINKQTFHCGYAVMTEKVQIYQSLTFQKLLQIIIPSSITMVRYEEDTDYQIITIEQGSKKIQCGFLDNKKFDLFDRMLFLQKNMSRSTSTRLFQNQLIKSIYAQYQK